MATQFASSFSSSLPRIGPQTALFLDFDGTLADLAPQPEAVQVVAELVPVLRQLAAQLSGALAIVSGRKLADLDGFLAPLLLPAAAEHGAQRRPPQGELIRLASPDLQEAARLATALAARHAGLRVEIKTATVALHYRQAPELQALALQVMLEAAHSTPGVELLRGKSVFEIKPAGISKGTAIEAFMAQAPFAGRLPLFAGDDTTDEAGFSAVQHLGGEGIKVGKGATLAHYRCQAPAALRQWLQQAACQDFRPAPGQNSEQNETMERSGQ
jgi:trehalose 6-phosphate phosphatase